MLLEDFEEQKERVCVTCQNEGWSNLIRSYLEKRKAGSVTFSKAKLHRIMSDPKTAESLDPPIEPFPWGCSALYRHIRECLNGE